MTEEDKVKFLESNLERQLHWIAHAESKSSVILSGDTAMLGVLAAISPTLVSEWSAVSAFFTIVTSLLIISSLICLFRAAFPQTDGPPSSLVFFGCISQLSTDQYWKAISTLTSERYANDLALQCHRNAQIAQSKFSLVQKALGRLYLAVPPWIAAVYLLRTNM